MARFAAAFFTPLSFLFMLISFIFAITRFAAQHTREARQQQQRSVREPRQHVLMSDRCYAMRCARRVRAATRPHGDDVCRERKHFMLRRASALPARRRAASVRAVRARARCAQRHKHVV